VSLIAPISGNIAIDLAIVIFLGAELLRLASLTTIDIVEVSDERAQLKALSATLELKSAEIAALRRILVDARKEQLAQQELVHDQHQDRLSTALALSGFSTSHDHSEIEGQLARAAGRIHFDA